MKNKYKSVIGLFVLSSVLIGVSPIFSKTTSDNHDNSNNKIGYFYNHSLLDPIVSSHKKNLQAQGGSDFSISNNIIKVQGSSIINIKERLESDIKNIREKIVTYIVQEGDTVSKIAKNFGVSQNTIIWENDIKRSVIRPGQELKILPITGLQYKIKKGDTLAKIAKKYKAIEEEIFDFNDLNSDLLTIGDFLIVPDGEKETPRVVKRSSTSSRTPTKRIRYTKTNYGWLTHPAPGSVRTQGLHRKNSIDMGAPTGTPILAAASGIVTKSYYGGWGGGYGSHIKIQHPNGVVTLYAHLSKNKVWVGQKIVKGQVIGLMGSTGRSTGPHLHFEVRGATNPF